MSKSKGNFITLEGAIAMWGADATRFTCADSGDGILAANYDRTVADRTILALTTELEWTQEILKGGGKAKGGGAGSGAPKVRAAGAPRVWLDTWFANEMIRLAAEAAEKYEAMRFKDALKVGFYLMREARDRYRAGTAHIGADAELVRQWAEWQALFMVPITPHWSEAMWEMLGKDGCAVQARWPTASAAEDAAVTAAGSYLFDVAHSLASSLQNRDKKKPAKGAPAAPTERPNQVHLYVAQKFPRWKEIVLDLLLAHYDEATGEVDGAVMKSIPQNKELAAFNKGKQVPQFAAMVREEAKTKGKAAFALAMPFDELKILSDNVPYLCATLNVSAVHLLTDEATAPQPEVYATAVPGKPAPHFFFDADTTPPTGAGAPAASASAAKPTRFAYLEKHGVAAVLNDAVNQLGSEQPADPYAWLAAHLASVAKTRAAK